MTFFFFKQIKKLVYVYLVRYAEEQQDLALLSISTFQRALKVNDTVSRQIVFTRLSQLNVLFKEEEK
jgi:AP-3 complex subunit beta